MKVVDHNTIRFSLRAWAAWDFASDAISRDWSSDDLRKVPSELRRRVSPIGRRCLECGWLITSHFEVNPKIILASRHGEFTRTFDLLQSIDKTGEVSPADFSLSVHHALAGLLSIVTRNEHGHLAVAAGKDSFGFGLLEAAASLAESETSVLLLYFDEVLPDFFNELIAQPDCPQAFALLLERPQAEESKNLDVEFTRLTDGCAEEQNFSWKILTAPTAQWVGDQYSWRLRLYDSSLG